MNSADVFSLEFDMLTRTSALAKTLEWFRGNALAPAIHRQLLLELNHVINVHSRLREVAADVVPTEDWAAWQELLAVPSLAFDQGRAFLDDLRALGLNSMDSVSLTPLPQTIAMAAYAHYQLVNARPWAWWVTCGSSNACRGSCTRCGPSPVGVPAWARRRCGR